LRLLPILKGTMRDDRLHAAQGISIRSVAEINPRAGDVFMNRFGLIGGVAIAVLLSGAAIADDQHVVAQLDSLRFAASSG
jgi:hypothetical protein